jgi:hypothetical protein
MGRSGYVDDYEETGLLNLYRAAVERAIKGKRGQAFLREMLAALDALPEKRLIAEDLERDGEVCAIGSVGVKRGLDMTKLDPIEPELIADAFGIAPSLVREIEYINDDDMGLGHANDEARFKAVRQWILENLHDAQ